jgi:hypothetical protein
MRGIHIDMGPFAVEQPYPVTTNTTPPFDLGQLTSRVLSTRRFRSST